MVFQPQQVVQSLWPGGLQASGHSCTSQSPAETIAATKLLVEFFLLVGKGVVLGQIFSDFRSQNSDDVPGKLFTEVSIMGDGCPLSPGPDVSLQESLEQTVILTECWS